MIQRSKSQGPGRTSGGTGSDGLLGKAGASGEWKRAVLRSSRSSRPLQVQFSCEARCPTNCSPYLVGFAPPRHWGAAVQRRRRELGTGFRIRTPQSEWATAIHIQFSRFCLHYFQPTPWFLFRAGPAPSRRRVPVAVTCAKWPVDGRRAKRSEAGLVFAASGWGKLNWRKILHPSRARKEGGD